MKIDPGHDMSLQEMFVQTALEYASRLHLVKYFGMSKSLEIAALILGPAANLNEKADVILTPYRELAQAIDQWLLQFQSQLTDDEVQLYEKLRSNKK
jgi:hypothetical protein